MVGARRRRHFSQCDTRRFRPMVVVTSNASHIVAPTNPSSARQSTTELWAVSSLKLMKFPNPTPNIGECLRSSNPVAHASSRSAPSEAEIPRPPVKSRANKPTAETEASATDAAVPSLFLTATRPTPAQAYQCAARMRQVYSPQQ
jgi:hypothetical protein